MEVSGFSWEASYKFIELHSSVSLMHVSINKACRKSFFFGHFEKMYQEG
jgi:hypothetical protein